ncbi:MAG: hypothetical protein Q4B75_07940 [Eubacteriales bacterium]|nr:hypothetical protein [Eubacteriales bacterium]
MKIIQVRTVTFDEIEKDTSVASVRIEQLYETLEETGFMDSKRSLIFRKMIYELDRVIKEIESDKENTI